MDTTLTAATTFAAATGIYGSRQLLRAVQAHEVRTEAEQESRTIRTILTGLTIPTGFGTGAFCRVYFAVAVFVATLVHAVIAVLTALTVSTVHAVAIKQKRHPNDEDLLGIHIHHEGQILKRLGIDGRESKSMRMTVQTDFVHPFQVQVKRIFRARTDMRADYLIIHRVRALGYIQPRATERDGITLHLQYIVRTLEPELRHIHVLMLIVDDADLIALQHGVGDAVTLDVELATVALDMFSTVRSVHQPHLGHIDDILV